MSRSFESGAIYSDQRVSGERVCCIPGKALKTHGADIAFPPGEPWGLMFLCQTTRGPWKFAGKAHGTGNCWEWIAGKWTEHGPTNGTNGFVYDLAGNLHIIAPGPDVNSQGYRRNADGSISDGRLTYGPFHGLSEYSDLGDGLYIGQGDPDHGTPTGVILWDGKNNRLLQAGHSTFLRVDRAGEAVAITFSTPSGCVFLQTTMAELRSLPVVSAKPPEKKPDPPAKPEPPKMPQVPQSEIDRALAALHAVASETGFGPNQPPLPFVRAVAQRLGGKWGLNGKRGNANDPSGDILAFDFAGAQPQLFDVLGDAGGANTPQFSALEYPQSAGAVWLNPGAPPPVQNPGGTPGQGAPPPVEVERPHPSYDAMMALVSDMGSAYREGRGFRAGVVMPPATTAHLVYRFLVEGYTAEALVQDARERGQG